MNSPTDMRDGDGPEARWSLQLFGGFRLRAIEGESVPLTGKRERVLLAYLATAPNCRESRRKLAALLWGDADDQTLLDNLRVCVWGLRKALNDTERLIVASRDDSIVLDPRYFEIDVRAFRQLAGQSDRGALERAAGLHTGEFLGDLAIENEEFQNWARDEGGRLRDLAIEALDRLTAQLDRAGEAERAIEASQRIIALDPLHEGAVRRLMRLYSRTGRRGTAFQLYRSLAETLKSQLGAEPEAETRLLFDEISRGDGKPKTPGETTIQPRQRETGTVSKSDDAPQSATVPRRSSTPTMARAGLLGLALVAAVALVALYVPMAGTPDASAVLKPALAAPDKPSIAILPFGTLGSDPSQNDLADALTNDITTALSIASEIFVIDRLATLAYGEMPARATQVAADLGVRYVLEGSVQRSADRVRVSVALVDGSSGQQTWAERFEREMSETFALQDEITLAVLTELQVQLTEGEQERMATIHGTRNLEAWITAAQGLKSIRRLTREDNARARTLYRQATALDPNYPGALDGLAWSHLLAARFGWSESAAADLAIAAELAHKALALDPMRSRAYALLGAVHLLMNDHVQAVEFGERAVALEPNGSEVAALLALTLTYTDDVERSPDLFARAIRLSPYFPDWYRWALGRSYRLLGRHEEAESVLAAEPGTEALTAPHLAEWVATLMELGRETEARAKAAQILSIAPTFSTAAWIANPMHQNAAVAERERDLLRRAGLP